MIPEKYSMSRLAVEFGYDRRTIAKRIGITPPVGKEGRSKLYLIKDVAPLLVDFPGDDGLDYHGQRTRLTRLQADRLQFEMDVEQGRFVLASEVEERWGDEFYRVRNRLLILPPKLAPMLVGIKTPAEAAEIIKTEIYGALNELSQPTHGDDDV